MLVLMLLLLLLLLLVVLVLSLLLHLMVVLLLLHHLLLHNLLLVRMLAHLAHAHVVIVSLLLRMVRVGHLLLLLLLGSQLLLRRHLLWSHILRHLGRHTLSHLGSHIRWHLGSSVLGNILGIVVVFKVNVVICRLALDARNTTSGSVASGSFLPVVVLGRLLLIGNGLLVSLNELVGVGGGKLVELLIGAKHNYGNIYLAQNGQLVCLLEQSCSTLEKGSALVVVWGEGFHGALTRDETCTFRKVAKRCKEARVP